VKGTQDCSAGLFNVPAFSFCDPAGRTLRSLEKRSSLVYPRFVGDVLLV
jgi:hypothetical protein